MIGQTRMKSRLFQLSKTASVECLFKIEVKNHIGMSYDRTNPDESLIISVDSKK